MRPRVFILQPGNKDFSGADKFGDVAYIYDKNEPRPSIWDENFVREALDRLVDADYQPRHDYVMLAGHMVPIVLFCCALCNAYPAPKVLCYDIVSGNYVTRSLGNEREARATVPGDERFTRAIDRGAD